MNIPEQRAHAAYVLLAHTEKMSRRQLARKLKVSERAVARVLTEVRRQGHIVRCETGSVYWLDDEARDNARFQNRNLDGFV